MKAIVWARYGSADVLHLRDLEWPRADDDEVLVRVRAAGLDRGAWHIMAGLPYLIRHAVRAPGVKWTRFACTRAGAGGQTC